MSRPRPRPVDENVPAIEVRRRGNGVTEVVVGRGSRRNALREQDWADLADAVGGLDDGRGLRAVVVSGRGDTFSAGSDVRQWRDASAAEIDRSFATMERALRAVEALPVPTVAVLRGDAVGAGCQLALACDVRLAETGARIGMPVVRLGIMLSADFALRLAALIGPARTRDLLYSGRLLTAAEALRWGLVSALADARDLEAHVTELTGQWARQPDTALRAAKAAVAATIDHSRSELRLLPPVPSSDGALPARVAAFLDAHR